MVFYQMRNGYRDIYDAEEGREHSWSIISERNTDNDITRGKDRNFIVNVAQLLLHYADERFPFLQYVSVSLSQQF